MRRGFLNTPAPTQGTTTQATSPSPTFANAQVCPICLEEVETTIVALSTPPFIVCSNGHYSHKECIAGTFKQECPVCRVSLTLDTETSARINRNAQNMNAEWTEEYERNWRNTYSSTLDSLTSNISQALSDQLLIADTRARMMREFRDVIQYIPLQKVKEILIEKINTSYTEEELRNLLATEHYRNLVGSARGAGASSRGARGSSSSTRGNSTQRT